MRPGCVKYLDAAGLQRAAVSVDRVSVRQSEPAAGRERIREGESGERLDEPAGGTLSRPTARPVRRQPAEGATRSTRSNGARRTRRSRSGLKLHFGNSDVDLDNPAHVQKLQRVFRAANDHRMAIVVHMRSSVTMRRAYGAKEARVFLTEVLPSAPDIPVQIAHLTGGGTYDDPATDEARLGVRGRGRAQRSANGPCVLRHLRSRRLRKVDGPRGSDRDAHPAARRPAHAVWLRRRGARRRNCSTRERGRFSEQLPMSNDEFRVIAGNVAPYMR